jgi:hypothetical protein
VTDLPSHHEDPMTTTTLRTRALSLAFLITGTVSTLGSSRDAFADGGPPTPASGWGTPPPNGDRNDAPAAPSGTPKPSTTKATASIELSNTTSEPEKAPAEKAQAPRQDADRPSETTKPDPLDDSHFLHGFRLGYSYVYNYDQPLPSLGNKSFADRTGTKSPHNFLLGYEMLVRLMGHSWLNVILLANALVAGLEQSKVLPSGNAVIGFEIHNSFQLGVGAHLTPLKGQEGHVVVAGGWTPRVGNFYIPVHGFFVPDVEGNHRMGVLTGVTW